MTTVKVIRPHPLLLPLLAFAQFVLALDYNIVLVALPQIGIEVGMTEGALQWVISAYALAFGGLLLLGGRLSDVFGQRRFILSGFALFAVGSLAAAVATDPVLLLVGRALQGVAGALLTPAVLATIALSYDEGPQRFRALAVWSSAGAIGLALGSAFGGVLMAFFNWRSVFILLIPLSVLGLLISALIVPRVAKDRQNQLVDYVGGSSVALGVAAIVYALAEVPVRGPDSTVLTAAFVGITLLIFFVLRESRIESPLLPLSLLRHRSLSVGIITMVFFMGSIGTSYYVFTLFSQVVLQNSALVTGLAFLPWGMSALFASKVAQLSLGRIGLRGALTIGLLASAVGTAGLGASLSPTASLIAPIAWTAVLGAGQAIGFASLYAAAGAGVAPEQQGVASALMSTVQQVGTALGLAILIGLAGLVASATSGGEIESITRGLQIASWTGAAGLVVATAVTWSILPSRTKAVREGSR